MVDLYYLLFKENLSRGLCINSEFGIAVDLSEEYRKYFNILKSGPVAKMAYASIQKCQMITNYVQKIITI